MISTRSRRKRKTQFTTKFKKSSRRINIHTFQHFYLLSKYLDLPYVTASNLFKIPCPFFHLMLGGIQPEMNTALRLPLINSAMRLLNLLDFAGKKVFS